VSLRADGRVRSLPLSLALHGLAVGAAALLSIRSLPDASDPPIPVVFLEGSAAPLPLGEESGTSSAEVVQTDPTEAASVDGDSEDFQETASSEVSPDSSSSPGENHAVADAGAAAAISGNPRGQTDGRPDGQANSHGQDGTETGDDERLYRPGGNVAEPRLVYRVEPAYPEIARKARIEGVVILQAIIGKAGNVEDLHLVKSVNVLLDAAALEAVSRWRYRPATLAGFAVRGYLTVTVEFRLR
jgi:TonB family protein